MNSNIYLLEFNDTHIELVNLFHAKNVWIMSTILS